MSPDSSEASGSTAERVAAALRAEILTGRLRTGAALREVALAERLGVSRNTLRESVRMLVFDGLIEHSPNRGARVATLGVNDARDIHMVRRVLELAALQRAVNCRPRDLRALGAALMDLEVAADQHDAFRMVETDLRFHRRLVDLIGSERLSAWFGTVERQLRLAFVIVASTDHESDDPGPLIEEHRELFDAIAGGNLETARKLLEAHLDKYESRCIAVLGANGERTALDGGTSANGAAVSGGSLHVS
jgi:DNA-binding GntR family transcriptional regulator